MQLKESGYLELPNVHLIRPSQSYNGNLLKWSDGFGMREEAYQQTQAILEAE